MNSIYLSHSLHVVPTLSRLEDRAVPAGTVAVAISAAGALSLTGDDNNNVITIKVQSAPNQVTVTPDATTDVGFGPGMMHTFPAPVAVKSLTADLKGGDDALFIDSTSDFILSGAASFKLGDGNNFLILNTAGKIQLGSLAVTGGDGDDTAVVVPGLGLGEVTGSTSFNYGVGKSITILNNTTFSGRTGVKINVAPKGGSDEFDVTNSTITGTLTANTGSYYLAPEDITGSNLGGLTVNGVFPTVTMATTTVNGNISEKATFASELQPSDSTVTGDVTLNGSFESYLKQTAGTFAARNVTISGGTFAELSSGGTSTTINGNLSLSGKLENELSFSTTALSEVKGNIKLNGGSLSNGVEINSKFRADKDVNLTLGDGLNEIGLGDGAAPLVILGNLKIKTGAGEDEVSLENVAVTKKTTITLGAGGDELDIDKASTFTGTFSADLGAGDDVFSVAQSTGATGAVTFTGKATIKMGAGNDTLLLGLAPGDANSKAVFSGAGSKIDGGTGINLFDGLTPTESPSQFTGLSVGDFLKFTDPNP